MWVLDWLNTAAENVGEFVTNAVDKVQDFAKPILDNYEDGQVKEQVTRDFMIAPETRATLEPFMKYATKEGGIAETVRGALWLNTQDYDQEDFTILKTLSEKWNQLQDPNMDPVNRQSEEENMKNIAAKLKRKPTREELGTISKTLWGLNERIGTITPIAKPQEPDAEQSITQKKSDELATHLYQTYDPNKNKGLGYFGGKLSSEPTEVAKRINILAYDPNIQHVYSMPEKLKAKAQEILDKDPTNKLALQSLTQANQMIAENDAKVTPFLERTLENMWVEWKNMNQMAKAYKEKTGINMNTVFWDYWINRWDIADYALAGLKIQQSTGWYKLMEIWGKATKTIDMALNWVKWMIGSVTGVNQFRSMDMETLNNVDSEIMQWKNFLSASSNIGNFWRRMTQIAPEIATQVLIAKGTGLLTKPLEAAQVLKSWQIWIKAADLGTEMWWLISKWDTFTKLARWLAKAPEIAAMMAKEVEAGKSVLPIIQDLSKTDYFLSKWLAQPMKRAANNYVLSAAMQWHNPESYNQHDFFIDTAFAGLDIIVDTARLLTRYQANNIAYKNMFLENFAKEYWDVPEKEWKNLPQITKDKFNEASQYTIGRYNEVFKSQNPAELAEFIATKKAKGDITTALDKYNRLRANDPQWKLTFDWAKTANIIPEAMSKETFDYITKDSDTFTERMDRFDHAKEIENIIKKDPETLKKLWAMDKTVTDIIHENAISQTAEKVEKQVKESTAAKKRYPWKVGVTYSPADKFHMDDPEDSRGVRWEVKINNKKYNYEYFASNETPKSWTFKDEWWLEWTSLWVSRRRDYYLLEPGEKLVRTPGWEWWEYASIERADWTILDIKERKERLLRFVESSKRPGDWQLLDEYSFLKKNWVTTDIRSAKNVKSVKDITPKQFRARAEWEAEAETKKEIKKAPIGLAFPQFDEATQKKYKLTNKIIWEDPLYKADIEAERPGAINTVNYEPGDRVLFDGQWNDTNKWYLDAATDVDDVSVSTLTKSERDNLAKMWFTSQEEAAKFLEAKGFKESNNNWFWIKPQPGNPFTELVANLNLPKIIKAPIEKLKDYNRSYFTLAKKVLDTIPNLSNTYEWYKLLKFDTMKDGKLLRQRLREWIPWAEHDFRQFAFDVVDKFFPGMAKDFKEKIARTLDTITPADRWAMINVAEQGNIIWFIKFFDKETYESLKTNEKFASDFRRMEFNPWDFEKYQTVINALWSDAVEWRFMKRVKWATWLVWYPLLKTVTKDGKQTTQWAWKQLMSSSDRYKFWQTVLNFVGMPKMLMMNTMALASEEMTKYNLRWWSMEDLYDLRKTHGLLFDPADVALKWSSLKDQMLNTIDGIRKMYDAWFYNAADVALSSKIKNEMVGQAIEDITNYNTRWEFEQFLNWLSKDERVNVLTKIQQRADNLLAWRTGFFSGSWKNQVVFWGKQADLKRAAYWMYSMLAGRWIWMMKASTRTILEGMPALSHLLGNTSQTRYIKILESEWKEAADKYIKEFFTKNTDLQHLFEKIGTAFSLGNKLQRSMSDDDGVEWEQHPLKEAFDMWANFSYPRQAFQSTPLGRESLAFFTELFRDGLKDGLSWEDLGRASASAAEQFLKDLGRRFTIQKAILSSVSATQAQWKPFYETLGWGPTSVLSARQKVTWWYLYYSAQNIQKMNFDQYIPKTSHSWLMDIIPYTDDYIKEFRDATTDKKMDLLTGDPKNYFTNWLTFMTPLLKDWKLAQLPNNDFLVPMQEELGQDDTYINKVLKGEIPREKMWKDWGIYAFNMLTQFSAKWKNVEYFDDVRKKMWWNDKVKWIYNPNYVPQNQEDLFTYQALNALWAQDYDKVLKLFSEAKTWYQKWAVQLLMFAETKSPGAWRELLSAIVNNEAYLIRKSLWSAKLYETNPELDAEVKNYIGQKYGDLLYVVDKPEWYKNMALYYIRENYPQYKDVISDPINKIWQPQKNMNFVISKEEIDEDWNPTTSMNNALNNIFRLDLMAKLAMNDPKIWMDWFKIATAYATLWSPRWMDYDNPTYMKNMLIGVNHILDGVRKSDATKEDEQPIMAGILLGIYPVLSKVYKEHPELIEKLWDTWTDNMSFLHGITWDIIQTWKDVALKSYREQELWYSWTSGYTNKYPKTYRLNQALYNQIKSMSYAFNYFKNYDGWYPNYWWNYYNSTDWGILTAKGKAIDAVGKWKYSSEKWTGFEQPKQPEWRSVVIKAGRARAFSKKEDPDKPTDRASVTSFKRSMKRRAIKFDTWSSRKGLTKWWLYKSSYKGGDRKRRVSRAKGWNSKGSKQYKQADW